MAAAEGVAFQYQPSIKGTDDVANRLMFELWNVSYAVLSTSLGFTRLNFLKFKSSSSKSSSTNLTRTAGVVTVPKGTRLSFLVNISIKIIFRTPA